ncbi:MAG: pyridoxal 5'-phosphate synthase glutaminase subunit PdxT [Bryobacterales bacterium]|jgi:5'-phosphate synthase pdxT subunit|nr:pyridoxal 5'-phosphate synthase glutaminase subunit PdxT [Bryobacterales bacterium]
MPTIGVLALQGDFEAHLAMLREAGAPGCEVRTAQAMEAVDALIIPGGESTTMLRLLRREHLWNALAQFGARKPIFGTCAGAILMANEVSHPQQESFAMMDIAVVRNGYGRQLDSRIVLLHPEPGHDAILGTNLEAVFIRAPIISRVGPEVEVLVRYNGDPVLVRQGHHLAASFHPELTTDHRIHAWFAASVRKHNSVTNSL